MEAPEFLRQMEQPESSLPLQELGSAISRFDQLHQICRNRNYSTDAESKVALISEEIGIVINLLAQVLQRRNNR